MGFPRQEYWSGLPFPSPGDLPDPGIEPRSPALKEDSLPAEPPGVCLWYKFTQASVVGSSTVTQRVLSLWNKTRSNKAEHGLSSSPATPQSWHLGNLMITMPIS